MPIALRGGGVVKKFGKKLLFGFSLVELMAAVSIVAVLVALALPRFRVFLARSRMAEAKTNLGIIYGLQQSYKAEYEAFGTIAGGGMGCGIANGCRTTADGSNAKNELGFRVTDCGELRYLYTSSISNLSNARASGVGRCKIYPDCAEVDQWNMNANRELGHPTNVVRACDE